MSKNEGKGITRREALLAAGTMAAGLPSHRSSGAQAQAQAATTAPSGGERRHGGLNWKEVYFTNCPMVSANNIDQELGWCKTDFKAKGIDYSYFRSRRETDWYLALHPQPGEPDPLWAGFIPRSTSRPTFADPAARLHLGLRRRCMAVRVDDPIHRCRISREANRPLQEPEHHQERLVAHPGAHGIANMLMLHNMTMKDVQIVEFPYADDWYDSPKMMEPMINPTDLWATRDHKRDLAFRPMEAALLSGKVDAIYTQSKVFQHLQEDRARSG